MCIDCQIVRDLLPMYVDDCLSPASKSSVREHLRTCRECRAYLGGKTVCPAVKKESPDGSYVSLAARIKKRKTLNTVLIGASIAVLLAYGIYKTAEKVR